MVYQDTLEYHNSLPQRSSPSPSLRPPVVAFVQQENCQAPTSRPLGVSHASNGYRNGVKFVYQQQNPINQPRSTYPVVHLDSIVDSMLKLESHTGSSYGNGDHSEASDSNYMPPPYISAGIRDSFQALAEPTSSAASISTFPPQSGPQRTAAQKPSGGAAPYTKDDTEKKFVCGECGKRMKRNGDMKRHMKKHGGFTLKCDQPECTSKFKREDSLKRHMQTQHNLF